MSKVQFSTTLYQCAHGKAPRGFGSWAFSLGQDYDLADELAGDGQPRVLWFTGTYTAARKQAAAAARGRGFDRVLVCS